MLFSCFSRIVFCALILVLTPVWVWAQTMAVPSGAKSDTPTVSIGPGLFSLTELARTLSTPDAPLQASPRVAHRIGFVRLHRRSHADARRLITQAFALSETSAESPGTGNVWNADPLTNRREADWRATLAGYLSGEATRVVNDWAALAALEPDDLKAEVERREQAQKALYAAANASGNRFTFDEEQAFIRALRDTTRAREVANDRNRHLTARLQSLRSIPLATLIPTVLRDQFHRTSSGAGLRFEYGSNFTFDVTLKDEWKPVELGRASLAAWFWGTRFWNYGTEGAAEPLLGPKAARWLRDEERASEPFLQSSAANTDFALDPALPSDTVGARVWQWSAAHNRDAISEVFPSLDATEARGSLRSVLRWDLWSAREVDGALIVSSRLAFLARPQTQWETEALLVWVRNAVKRAQTQSRKSSFPFGDSDLLTEQVPLSHVLAYSRAAWQDKRYHSWTYPRVKTSYGAFWHLRPRSLDSAALVGQLWEMLPAERQTVPDARQDLSLSGLGPRARRLVLDWCRATGTLHADDPAFQSRVLDRTTLALEPVKQTGGDPDGGRAVRVWLAFPNPDGADFPRPNLYPSLTLLLDQ